MRMEWPPVGDDEDCISHVAYDLMTKLMTQDPKKRLGAKGAQEVKDHKFFAGVNWDLVRTKEAPIIPYSMKEIDEPEKPSLLNLGSANISRNPSGEPGHLGDISPNVRTAKALRRGSTLNSFELKGFVMRRLDVLDQHNQEKARDLIKQKSGRFTIALQRDEETATVKEEAEKNDE